MLIRWWLLLLCVNWKLMMELLIMALFCIVVVIGILIDDGNVNS